MIIVIDTTAFHEHWDLSRAHFQALIRFAKGFNHTIVLPGVVVEEIIRHYEAHTEKLLKDYRSVLKRADSIVFSEIVPRPSQQLELSAIATDYRKWFEEELDRIGVTVADYPTTPHGYLVSRAVAGKKPFSSDGKFGYKDALIWETVLQLVSEHKDQELVFVTGNSGDFFDDDKTGLHVDLLDTLREAGHDKDRVEVFLDIKQLYDKHVAHLLEPIERLQDMVKPQLLQQSILDQMSDAVRSRLNEEVAKKYPPPAFNTYWIGNGVTCSFEMQIPVRLHELGEAIILAQADFQFSCHYKLLVQENSIAEPPHGAFDGIASGTLNVAATIVSDKLDISSLDISGIVFRSSVA